jgi:hypothetical protein
MHTRIPLAADSWMNAPAGEEQTEPQLEDFDRESV